jgi:hypothetical protein
MILRDFECRTCGKIFEALVRTGETISCSCGSADTFYIVNGTRLFTTIVPMTRNSKKRKAGYHHSHGDKPATKVYSTGADFPE